MTDPVLASTATTTVEVLGPLTWFRAVGRGLGDRYTVTAAGDLDASNLMGRRRAVAAAFEESSARDIDIHLGEAQFIDTMGVTWLVELLNAAERKGGRAALLDIPPTVLRVLTLSGAAGLFRIEHAEGPASP